MNSTNDNPIFRLASNARIVKGINRSSICDLYKEDILLIPNILFEIILKYQGYTLQNILAIYNDQNNTIIEYFDFLEQNDLIIWCQNKEEFDHFIEMNLEWDYPALITNAIIEYNTFSTNEYISIIEQLVNLGCNNIEVRFYNDPDISLLTKFLEFFKNSPIRNIVIYIPYHTSLLSFFNKFPRISHLIFFNFPPIDGVKSGRMNHSYTSQNIQSKEHCGNFSSAYLFSNIKFFTESQHHNTCLNRKIAIDIDGNIKNCPSMVENFGNIKDTTLTEAIEKPGFKKYWNIKKDSISVCKDCEFRHVCTDCRAYLENPEDIYSKPLKCGYNPYTCEWEEWSTHPMKQKAIEHYGMQELVKKI